MDKLTSTQKVWAWSPGREPDQETDDVSCSFAVETEAISEHHTSIQGNGLGVSVGGWVGPGPLTQLLLQLKRGKVGRDCLSVPVEVTPTNLLLSLSLVLSLCTTVAKPEGPVGATQRKSLPYSNISKVRQCVVWSWRDGRPNTLLSCF